MSDTDSHPLDLRDASQAGVYRVMCADVAPLLVLASKEGVSVHEINLGDVDDKRAVLERIHAALGFPHDWGRNWDALVDGLDDLSWLGDAAPRLLVWRGMDALHAAQPQLEAMLIGILEDSSASWAEDGIALWSLVCLARMDEDAPDDAADR